MRRTRRTRAAGPASEDQAPVGHRMPHPDLLVDADRDSVVAADEEADRRHALEQQAAEIPESTLRVAPPPSLRVDPHLLQLDRAWRPGRGFGLEQDGSAFGPDPGAPLVELGAWAPAGPCRTAGQRVDPDHL